MTDVMALSLLLREEGSATLAASLRTLGAEVAKTAAQFGAVTFAINAMVRETAEADKVQTQLRVTLESTNGVSGQTIDTLNAQSQALMNVTAFSDEAIGSAQALLLQFTNVRSVFAQAIPVVLDLATKMGMDLNSAALLVGKALNAPEKAAASLMRAKISLTKAEEEAIEKFLLLNNIAAAQGIILNSLRAKTGGQAEAYRNTLGGAIDALKVQFNNLFEAETQTTQSLTTSINTIARGLSAVAPIAAFFIDNFVKGLVTIGTSIGVIGLALTRLVITLGGIAVNIVGAFATFLPGGLGDKAAQWLDGFNEKLNNNDRVMAGWQESMKEFRAQTLIGPEMDARPSRRSAPTPGDVDVETTSDALKKLAEEERDAFAKFDEEYRQAAIQSFNDRYDAIEEEDKAFNEALASMMAEHARDSAAAFATQMDILNEAMANSAREKLSGGVSESIQDGLASGLTAAIQSGRIDSLWKGMAQTLVSKLANVMVDFALRTKVFATMMANIKRLLAMGNGTGAVLAAGALLAFAYANGGKSSMGNNTIAGGSSGITSQINAPIPTTRMVFNGTSAAGASGLTPVIPMTFNVIGPNDPSAQRAIQELITKANRRGNV